MTPFEEFAAAAAEVFGLTENEAADLLDALGELEGFDLEYGDRLEDFPGAADLLDDVVDFDDISEPWWDDALDPDWPFGDDDWMDEGEELEVTTSYEEKGG